MDKVYAKEHRLKYDEKGTPFLVIIENKNKKTRVKFLGSMNSLKFLNR